MTTLPEDQPDSGSLELVRLIRRGRESRDVDFKGPGNWQSWNEASKAELVRDMMAMGNGDRPGWIIIGVATGPAGEALRQGLEEAAAKSFDPTPIGEKVRQHCDPEIEFDVYRVTVDERWYVAIHVSPFPRVPYLCRAGFPRILVQGAFYTRSEAAQSVKVNRAEQMRRIPDRATLVHADSIVRRMEQLIERSRGIAPRDEPPTTDPLEYERLLREMRDRAAGHDDQE